MERGTDKEFYVDYLKVEIYPNRVEMGAAAARVVGESLRQRLAARGTARVVFAAAPSQNDFLDALSGMPDIDWSRIIAFHMDEYIDLPPSAPQSFQYYLRERLFDKVPFKKVHFINAEVDDVAAECRRYAGLLREAPIDIVCMGIGENGHIAFNDPPVADFSDPEFVKVVQLDQTCRQQQVNDGCFAAIEEVPTKAVTLTVPALLSADFISVVVPGPTKEEAVRKSLYGPIEPSCPASILRKHKNALLFLDPDSAARPPGG